MLFPNMETALWKGSSCSISAKALPFGRSEVLLSLSTFSVQPTKHPCIGY